MTVYHAAWAWLGGDRLVPDVVITESNGSITTVGPGQTVPHHAIRLDGVVLPGLVNAHSHAFHRALRHRTHGAGGDFWAWREAMLGLAGRLDPDSMAELAGAVYAGMALTGITTVAEFHYVHHDVDGVPYGDPNAMGHALIHAAHQAGIRLVLLDACYLRNGFDQPLEGVARRFGDRDAEGWAERVDLLRGFYGDSAMVRVGVAAHSVRAVAPDDLAVVAGYAATHGLPLHIHLSEQPAENEAAMAATGLSPTGLLRAAGGLAPGTAVVHATHADPADVARLGSAGVSVVACPATEADLGDGLGPFDELATAGATLAVGSDQQVKVDLFAEARGIEYHDRLRLGRRGIHSPAALMEAATVGGARAVGTAHRGIMGGAPCDLVAVDPLAPALAGWSPDDGVAGVVFGGSAAAVTDVVVAGRRIVSSGAHHDIDDVVARIDRAVRAVTGVSVPGGTTVLVDLAAATMTVGGEPYGLIDDAALIVDGETISWVGDRERVVVPVGAEVVSVDGRLVTPGLVDCHTHLVFGGTGRPSSSTASQGSRTPRSPPPAAESVPRSGPPGRRPTRSCTGRRDAGCNASTGAGRPPSRSSRAMGWTRSPSSACSRWRGGSGTAGRSGW